MPAIETAPPRSDQPRMLHGGRRKMWWILVVIVLVGILGAGGYIFAQRAGAPLQIIGKGLEQMASQERYRYEAGIKVPLEVPEEFSSFLKSGDIMGVGAGGGSKNLIPFNIVVTVKGEVDAPAKKGVGMVTLDLISPTTPDAYSGEIEVRNLSTVAYIKVNRLPGGLSFFTSMIGKDWIQVDTSGLAKSAQASEFEEALGAAREDKPQKETAADTEATARRKEAVQAFLKNPETYEILEQPPLWDVALRRGPYHYRMALRKEKIAELVALLSEVGGTLAPVDSLKNAATYTDEIKEVRFDVWVNVQSGQVEKLYAEIEPALQGTEQEVKVGTMEVLVTVSPPTGALIEAPQEFVTFEQLLGKIMSRMLGGFVGADELPPGVADTDTDGDGLKDYEELTKYYTDHTKADTDGDGFDDGTEVQNKFNPAGPGPLVEFDNPLENARRKSRDAKRVSDIKQIQTALELYSVDKNNGYPLAAEPVTLGEGDYGCIGESGFAPQGSPICANPYMMMVPTNPSSGGTPYMYQATTTHYYELNFSLETGSGGLPSGAHIATPFDIYPPAEF
jgi:hypothetical protein